MSRKSRRQQGARVGAGVARSTVVAFFVHCAWQLGNLLLLQRERERVQGVDAFQIGAGAFGVLADPVRGARSCDQRAGRERLLQRRLRLAAEIKGRRDQQQPAAGGARRLAAHGSTNPAARSMRQVRIKGRPISAVGSSLTMASSKAMPSPSLLALPAQS